MSCPTPVATASHSPFSSSLTARHVGLGWLGCMSRKSFFWGVLCLSLFCSSSGQGWAESPGSTAEKLTPPAVHKDGREIYLAQAMDTETRLELDSKKSSGSPESGNKGRHYALNHTRPTRMDPSLYAVLADPTINPMLQEAWQNLQHGQWEQAESDLRDFLREEPSDAPGRFLLARLLLMPGTNTQGKANAVPRRDQARTELATIIARNLYAPAFVDLIELTLEDGHVDSAERLLTRLVAWQPEDPMTYYAQGRVSEAKMDWAAARGFYQKGLMVQADSPAFHYRMAQVELSSGNPNAAWWALSQCLMVYPDDARVWSLLGALAEKRNQPQQALAYYQQATSAETLISLGRLLATQKQTDQALTLYAAAEIVGGNDPDILFQLGMLYAGLQRTQKAEKTLKRFIALQTPPVAEPEAAPASASETTGSPLSTVPVDPRLEQAKEALRKLAKAGTSTSTQAPRYSSRRR